MTPKHFIPLMIPDIRDSDIQRVIDVLKSGMLIQGKQVEQFENSVAAYLGVKHVIAVSNGTASLHMALVALGVGPGDEVIVPAFSYVATANAVELVGSKPVFIDVERGSFNIRVELIEQAITANTKVIMPVHEFGLACQINEICEIAKRRNIFVIEDAACALGAKINEQFVGSFGTFGSFSFHPRKAITSGEGGMLTTNDDELAEKVRQIRNHGISMSSGKMEFVAAGFNYRLTDFQAALLIGQFERFDKTLNRRKELANHYTNKLLNQNITKPELPIGYEHTWQSYHILLNHTLKRVDIIEKLTSEGIGVNYGAQCIPAVKFYQEKYNLDCPKLFPNSWNAYYHGLVLPLYEKLTLEDLEYVIEKVNELE